METTSLADQPPTLEATPAQQEEPSLQLSTGKKRPASEAELSEHVDGTDNGKEHAGDAGLPSPKRLKGSASPTEVDASDSASLGQQTDLPAPQASSKAHSGWNRGISSGLRTSFGSKDKLRKPTSQQASESPVQPPASLDVDSLTMPSGDVDLSKPGREGTWRGRFLKWSARLMALNKDQEGLKDAALLREAWGLWLETRVSLSRSQRYAAMEAAKKTDLGSEKLDEMFSGARDADTREPWINSPEPAGQPEGSESGQQSKEQPKSKSSLPGSQQETKEASLNDWTLPPPQSSSEFEVSQKNERGWQERFVSWCKSLARLNGGKIKANTPRERNRVSESYLRWVGTVEGMSKIKAAAARRAAVQYAIDNSALLAAIFADTSLANTSQTTEPASPPQEDAAPSPVAAVSDEHEEGSIVSLDAGDAEYREKYFPGIERSETFCHMCASRGHDAAYCPERTCRFCGDADHRSFSCPTRLRCTKCRQLGHAKANCTEKLALPQDEMECAFCQSRDHADASCYELWRSFLFNPGTARKVRSLPVYCYCCGHEGHYGPVCGLNPQRTEEGPWETWSQTNCERYVDPASLDVAIAFAASTGSTSSAGRPDLGKSIVPKRHIVFEEADDDDETEEFIRPPVQKSARVGHISFAGSSAGGGGARGGRQASNNNNNNKQYNGRSGNPPLPPGPPPPLPPKRYQENRNGGRRRGGGGRY